MVTVVRRRGAWTRRRRRARARKRRGPPTPGWTIGELETLARITRRTIADYVQRGLLVAPEFRGTATRYQREHLLRLLAIRLLKAEGVTRLKEIHARLQTMGSQELEAWVCARPHPEAVVQALAAPRTACSASPDRAAWGAPPIGPKATSTDPMEPTAASLPRASWQCIEFLPGLELAWRQDAGPLVQEIAERFSEQLARLVVEVSSAQRR